jgi:hypothetical protein
MEVIQASGRQSVLQSISGPELGLTDIWLHDLAVEEERLHPHLEQGGELDPYYGRAPRQLWQ